MKESEEQVTITTCNTDCGGRCVLKVHHRDNRITRITTDDGEEPQLRGCARGRASRYRLCSPERLKAPLKRKGERGNGNFEEISWDEALDTVASEIKQVKDKYGPESIFDAHYAGSPYGILHNTHSGAATRFFNMLGGRTTYGSFISMEAGFFGAQHMYGSLMDANEPDDLPNSRFIIMWGWNPAETIQGTNTSLFLFRAKEKGTKIICVDPCFTDSAKAFANKWIPIRPTTDAAMLIAMAHVMIKEEIYDREFVEKFTVGFDKYRDYVLGKEDGTPKTPGWAEYITGVPKKEIVGLAREYSTLKPAALMLGMGPGRTSMGEQYTRAGIALQAMTGNIGIPGGSSFCAGWSFGFGGYKIGTLPLEEYLPYGYQHYVPEGEEQSPEQGPKVHYIKAGNWADAILEGRQGGYPSDIKMVYVVGHNLINQNVNTHKGIAALKSVESIVVNELFMTPTARLADIILPVETSFEHNDVVIPWLKGTYLIYSPKIIEPPNGVLSDLQIFSELANRLGIADYNPKASEEEWLEEFVRNSDIPDYEEFKKKGIHRFRLEQPFVAFKDQIESPEENPFPTPSGKIEIYSDRLSHVQFEKSFYKKPISAIPTYHEDWEGPHTGLAKKYPLQIITNHTKYRIHSSFDNIPQMKEIYSPKVWINSTDARDRGIENDDLARVYNDRGALIIKSKVTERIMPGVVRIDQGGWFSPDKEGIDHGGCVNVLVNDAPSPAGCQNYNTTLVQIEKEKGE